MRKAILVLLLLFAPLVAADNYEAYGVMDEVTYGFSYGATGSMYSSIGPSFDGEDLIPVDGCSMGIIRQDGERGRVRAFAFFAGSTVEIDFANTTKILVDEPVDGQEYHAAAQHPKVVAELAMYGLATLNIDGYPYFDPVSEDSEFNASFVMTPTDFRNEGVVFDEQGGIFAIGDPALLGNQWETHLRIEGAVGESSTINQTMQPPNSAAPGRFTVNSQYTGGYSFYNSHFNGEGKIDIDFESEALAGMNELTFNVRAPDGSIVANRTVTAELQNPGAETANFPLDQFGFYYVEISGKVALSQYTLTVEQTSDEPFDLWLWWEETIVGVDAWQNFGDCYNFVGEPNAVVASEVGRIEPPQLNLTLVIMGIIGAIVILMTGARLFNQTIAAARFKNTHRRK